MRSLLILLCLAQSASANTHLIFGHVHNMSIGELAAWSAVPLPTTLKWEIGTTSNERIGWTVPITSNNGGFQQAFEVTAATAAAAGVDWSAWHSALNDPAYTRSFITIGGVEKEPSLVRYQNFAAPFDLDSLKLHVNDWGSVRNGFIPAVRAIAIDYDAVPEPASWLLMILGLLWVRRARR